MMHGGSLGGMGFGGFGFGSGFMILFWVLLIIGVAFLVKMLMDRNRSRPVQETAEEVLRRHYASGEITKEEFEERREVLRKS
jgi:putative membrane protein